MPLHVPPEKFPVHIAMQEPEALASHVPTHLPMQAAPLTEFPSHVPMQLPPQEPVNIAEHPASHEPVHIGAVQVPVHSPLHCTAALAVQEPLHVPMQAKLGAVTSHWALQVPMHATSTSPPVQLAMTSQFALAWHSASHEAWTLRSA
jgi:hypothetical protein